MPEPQVERIEVVANARKQYRQQQEELRRRRSQELFGHTGAHTKDAPTQEGENEAIVAALDAFDHEHPIGPQGRDGEDEPEFILWADNTWTSAGREEDDELQNASLRVVPKIIRDARDREIERLKRVARAARSEPPDAPEPVERLAANYVTVLREAQRQFEKRAKERAWQRAKDALAASPQSDHERKVETLRELLSDALHRMASVAGRLRVEARYERADKDLLAKDSNLLAELCPAIRSALYPGHKQRLNT